MTADALRDWCRFSGAGSAYIEPGSPWQNPYVESVGSRIRDELLAVELFSCLAEARVLIETRATDQHHPTTRTPHHPNRTTAESAEEITHQRSLSDSHSRYRGTPTTTTQLSQQVDR
jgi:hypothetical protein